MTFTTQQKQKHQRPAKARICNAVRCVMIQAKPETVAPANGKCIDPRGQPVL